MGIIGVDLDETSFDLIGPFLNGITGGMARD